MAYFNTNLIARRGYAGRPRPMSGLAGFIDDVSGFVKGAASSVLDFYGKTEQQKGANEALAAQNAALTAQLSQRSSGPLGMDTTTLLLLGGIGVGAVMLLRRRG
jgi:hypothetical protein